LGLMCFLRFFWAGSGLPHTCMIRTASSKRVWQACLRLIRWPEGLGSLASSPSHCNQMYTMQSNILASRGIVAFNFSPRNLTQVTSAMEPGQECMVWVCFGKENNSSRRVILKIELELNKLNSILSRSAVTPVFPLPLAQIKACRG